MKAEGAGTGSPHLSKTFIIAHLLAIVAVTIWAANHSLVKDLTAVGSPETLFLARFGVSAFFMILFLCFRPPKLKAMTKSDWVLVLILSLLCGPGYQWLLSEGSLGTSPALMSMLVATQTFHVCWLGYLLLKERIHAWHIAAIVAAFFGISMPVLFNSNEGNAAQEASIIYPLMVAGSGLIACIYVIVPRKVGPRLSAVDLMGLSFVLGFIFGLPFIATQGFFSDLKAYEFNDWAKIFWMGTFGTLLPVWCWWTALRTLRAMTVSLYTFLMIVASGMWGWLLLSVSVSWADGVAMGVVLIALMFNLKASKLTNEKSVSSD